MFKYLANGASVFALLAALFIAPQASVAQAPPTAEPNPQSRPVDPGDEVLAPTDENTAKDQVLGNSKPSAPQSPLQLLMKDGIPAHAEKRAILRDDLYALLATAGTAKEAKKIARQLERVWIRSGSDTVTLLLSRATRALKRKDRKLALELLDSVVDLAPDHAEAWNRRAFVHYATKNYDAAVGDLRRALALDQNHYKALDGLASIFRQIGDDAKALKVYEQLRQVHPHWPGLEKAYQDLKGKLQGRGI